MFGLQANIWKLYYVKISQWFLLIMPVFFLFYKNAGLTISQIFWVQSTYNTGAFLMEVPSGYVGDRFTRRSSLILGTFIAGSGYLTYYFTDSFYWFLLAALLMGIGTSFISGSDSAMLYDSLLELNREDDYMKYEGRATAFGNFAESIAAIIGGIIAISISIKTNLLVQGSLLLLGCVLMITSQEPAVIQAHERKSFGESLKFVMKEMKSNQYFKQVMLFSSFMGVNGLCMAWVVQPYMELHLGWTIKESTTFSEIINSTKETVTQNGVAWILTWVVLNFTVGVFSINSDKLYRKFNARLVWFIIISLLIPYLLLQFHYTLIIILAFLLFYGARGLVTPIFRKWINEAVPSHVRATSLSIRAFIFRIGFAVLGPIVGLAIDALSIETAFLMLFILFTVSALPFILFTIKSSKKE